MNSYSLISIIALCCYLFMFIALFASKKNPLIHSFKNILVAMILWTGGSFLMRLQAFPSYEFWYHVSLLGLLLFPYVYYYFITIFTGSKPNKSNLLWLVSLLVVFIINVFNGFFLAPPEIVFTPINNYDFIYHITWSVAILFALYLICILQIVYCLWQYSKKNAFNLHQITPLMVGILIMLLGHIILVFPQFSGIPTDIISGMINAILMLYILYKRSLFKLSLLGSRGSCYFFSAVICMFLFLNLIGPINNFILYHFHISENQRIVIIALLFSIMTGVIYLVIKKFIDHLFVRDEIIQAENLKNFSLSLSRTLKINELLNKLAHIIKETIPVSKVYICLYNKKEERYDLKYSSDDFSKKNLSFGLDHPIVKWLQRHEEILSMKTLRQSIEYRSMWEEEKHWLTLSQIAYFIPLQESNQLIGFIMLTKKERNVPYTHEELNFLLSASQISSIAIKNSILYEVAYEEARTDELTGLLNRKSFYEVLNEQYELHKNESLALIILSIDDFKLYNQLYGNKEGDHALKRISRIIEASVGENGFVARYSGKEFAIILPLYGLLEAKNLAETIRVQILEMNRYAKDYSLKVLTASAGICAIPYVATSTKQLIEYADMALYQVKRNGKNAVMMYSAGQKLMTEKTKSEEKVERAMIYSEYAPTIYALTATIDTKDHYTFTHSKNVAYYATKLAFAFGMDEDFVEIVREAALLHDIGKIGIPENILNKPGKLTDEEYEIMQSHVENSIGIIRYLPSLDYVIPAVIGHHERYDGNGYPRRIKGEDIPIGARILCIADCFDAMTSKRSYKESQSIDYALKELEEQAGRQFDPKLSALFIDCFKKGDIILQKADSYEDTL